MKPPSSLPRRAPTEQDFGLGAVARLNASEGSQQYGLLSESPSSSFVYDPTYQSYYDTSLFADPGEIQQSGPSDDRGTKRGASSRRTDTPVPMLRDIMMKSPGSKSKKSRKSKAEKPGIPIINAPLSELTKHMTVPLKDIEAWVNRPVEVRRREAELRKGRITRPMNSFMLYRSCYAERTKQFCSQNNHQVVSSISGASWAMEPAELRRQFDDWAKTDRTNHQIAHPDYKFAPSKSTPKRRRGAAEDQPNLPRDLGDSDGEYVDSTWERRHRSRQSHGIVAPLPETNLGFDTYPYFNPAPAGSSQLDPSQERTIIPYYHGGSIDLGANMMPMQPSWAGYTQGFYETSVSRPESQMIGGYGLPLQHPSTGVPFEASRNATPVHNLDHLNQQIIDHPALRSNVSRSSYSSPRQHITSINPQQLYAQQPYMPNPSRLPVAIDPSLTLRSDSKPEDHLRRGPTHDNLPSADAADDFAIAEGTSLLQTLGPGFSLPGLR